VEGKAPLKHTHTISDVTGLESALNGKMAADKTFSFADLSDIEGAKDAANNYVLYKSSNNNFTFGSAVSLLGSHQHKIEDIVGLDKFRAKLNEDLTAYGRLKQANEWQSYNKFTGKVTMSGGLELLGNASLNITHNNKVITSLSTSGSMLQGPLKVDGDVVYTKAQVDKLIASLVKQPVEILMTESGPIPFPEGITDDTYVEVWAWGGGGGGGNYKGGGGGGGGCVHKKIKWSQIKNTKNVLIGRGGKGFYTGQPKDVCGYGGFTRILESTIAGGGGGGAVNGHNSTGAVGGVQGISPGGLGGGYSSNSSSSNGRDSIFNGGGGGSYGEKSGAVGNGGNSILGGGGGASGDSSSRVREGWSVKGGNGGGSYNNKSGGGGGYFPGKYGDDGGDGGDGAVLFKFYI
ncbi:Bgr_08870 family protein, partial [Bartonella sp. ML69XJBT]|uniref:Bgr_08870 family protein n=1 Tax=Bartonella sp. ML69XJBT TaxID=3019092 RepID=UPI00235E9EE6